MTETAEQLFHAHGARVYRWAFALARRHDDALDAVQEVFMRLMRSGPTFPNGRAAVGWLRRVTTNVVIDHLRTAKTSRMGLEPAVEYGPPRVELQETAEQLRSALARLSDQQRLVLLSKCVDEMTFREIAEELGVAIPTVKTHYVRALTAIRAELQRMQVTGERL